MRLVTKLESVISVREVLLRLFFDFPVGFDPIKKLGAVASVFAIESDQLQELCHAVFSLLTQPCRCRRTDVSQDCCRR